MSELITTDDVFGDVRGDPEFEAERRKIASRTNLAINVNRLRNAKGWTQDALARAAGMRQPRIAEIERGDANPKLETITRLAIAFDVSDGELLADPDVQPRTDEIYATTVLQVLVEEWNDFPAHWREMVGVVSHHRQIAANDNFALAG